MADIFLSYAHADKPRIEKLASILVAAGYSLWWDREIDGGNEFSQDIERELSEADAVLVAWSKHSIQSRWVRDEASIALEDGKLIAISLDDTPPPIGFKQIHAIEMKSPQGEADLLRGLARKLERDPVTQGAAKSKDRRWSFITIPLLLSLVLSGWAVNQGYIPLPSFIQSAAQENIGIAVIPLRIEGNTDQSGHRIADDLASRLSALRRLDMASSSSTSALAEEKVTAIELAERLGVDYLVEGDAQFSDDEVNIRLRLIDGRSGRQIWLDKFDGHAREMDLLSARMAKNLGTTLQTRFDIGQGSLLAARDIDPRAHEEYLAGIEKMSLNENNDTRFSAFGHFRRAIEIDPGFGDAYAAMSYAMSEFGPRSLKLDLNQFVQIRAEANQRAQELAPDNPLTVVGQAYGNLVMDGELARAIELLEPLVREQPDYFLGRALLGQMYIHGGRYRDAYEQLEAAESINPFSDEVFDDLMSSLAHLDDLAAISRASQRCDIDCGSVYSNWFQGLLAFATLSEAREQMDLIRQRRFGDDSASKMDEADRDFHDSRRSVLLSVITGEKRAFAPPSMQILEAIIAAHLGNTDQAFEIAAEDMKYGHAGEIIELLGPGRLQFPPELRADPRYHALFEPRHEGIVDYRRQRGIVDGLPLKRDEVDAERLRIAKVIH